MAIRAAAGLGKSTQALKAIHERGLTADYFVPSHRLAAEQVDRFPPGVAIAIRGRDHKDEAHPIPLCAKHESVTALQKPGLATYPLNFYAGRSIRLPASALAHMPPVAGISNNSTRPPRSASTRMNGCRCPNGSNESPM